MRRFFISVVALVFGVANLALPVQAAATVSLTFSKTSIDIGADNVIDLDFTVEDFAINFSQFSCGTYLEFGHTRHLTGQGPYALIAGNGYSIGSWTGQGVKTVTVKKSQYPWASTQGTPVATRINWAFQLSIPANTFTAPGTCEVVATVTTLDGRTSNLRTGVEVSFSTGTSDNTFSGGDVVGKYTLTKEDSPYTLTSPIRLGTYSELRVSPGVEIFVEHDGPVFEGAGTGGIKILGTNKERISINNARTLWADPGGSTMEIRYVKFDNIGAIFEKSPRLDRRAFGVYISDSIFLGRSSSAEGGFNVSAQIVLERNYFSNLPAFEFGLWGSGSTKKIVRGNWFEGNSTDKGYWLGGEALTAFEDNVFSNFNSFVVQKQFPKKPRNNAAVPLNWLVMKSSYFDGLTERQSQSIAEKDQINGPGFSSPGFRFEDILATPPVKNYSLEPWVASSNETTKSISEEVSKPKFTAVQKTLTPYFGATTALTPQQKAQVKAAVDANPTAEKFICTGIRYYSQPMSVNIMVRKRAKAACEYAKQLNPELSTWFQNKPTKARSYAGKVLLTIKSPAS